MAAPFGGGHDLPPARKLGELDLKRGFLGNLAMQSRVQGFTEFDPASWQRIVTFGGGARAPYQEDFTFAKNDRADGDLRVERLRRRGQGSISDQMLEGRSLGQGETSAHHPEFAHYLNTHL